MNEYEWGFEEGGEEVRKRSVHVRSSEHGNILEPRSFCLSTQRASDHKEQEAGPGTGVGKRYEVV